MNRNKRSTSSLQMITVIAVSSLFLFTALFGLYKCFSRVPELEEDKSAAGGVYESVNDQQTQQDIQPVGDSKRKDLFYTILVGGLDNKNGGSDTNLLVSVDAKNKAIHVASLPRDTLLNVTWSVKKLNNAFHHGGFQRTCDEVSNLLGIPVDFYVTVDLQGFVELVDTIGGVDFDIPVKMDYDDPYQDLHIHFDPGMQHLSGEQALQVVRWRQNNDGSGYPTADIGRIGTQQKFLTAVAMQVMQLSNWDKISQYAQVFQEYVDTDLELGELVWFGEQALTIGTENIFFHTLPGDGAGYYKNVSYYVLDDQATLELVNSCFNPYKEDLSLEDMDIFLP